MSYDNQDYTMHQIHGYHPNCEWCAHERHRPRQKKILSDAMAERFKQAANAAERMSNVLKRMDEAEKSNPNGLVF